MGVREKLCAILCLCFVHHQIWSQQSDLSVCQMGLNAIAPAIRTVYLWLDQQGVNQWVIHRGRTKHSDLVCSLWCLLKAAMAAHSVWVSERQFTQHKFLHQTKRFCWRLTFLLHDNDVLAPLKMRTFETGFQIGIFWNCCLLSGCVNWQAECLWRQWWR